ncbi:MAG: hypothetical protein PHS17_03275 [Desulfobacterales bacterium]|nr:hypothetical protein [Desulfobacterales bacterium]
MTSPFRALARAFDLGDVFVLLGLAGIGYGTFLHWGEWLAFLVCGGLVFLIGCIMVVKG